MVFVSINRSDGDEKGNVIFSINTSDQARYRDIIPYYSVTKRQFSDFKFLVIFFKEQKVTLAQFNVPLLVEEFKWHSELDHLNSCFKKNLSASFLCSTFLYWDPLTRVCEMRSCFLTAWGPG